MEKKLIFGGSAMILFASLYWGVWHFLWLDKSAGAFLSFWYVLMVFLAILLLSLWVALKRWAMVPLRVLAQSNTAVVQGRLEDAVIPEESIPQDEIGTAMRTRNAMLTSLHSEHTRLVQEVAERTVAEEALQQSKQNLERQVAQQSALLKIGQAVQEMTQPSDLEQVLTVCWEHLRGVGIDFQTLMFHRLFDEENKIFESFEIYPNGPRRGRGAEYPDIYRLWSTGEVTYRPDLTIDMGGFTRERLEEISARCGSHIRCILHVPHPCGMLTLLSAHPDAFSASEIGFVEQVALMLSLGILRVQGMEFLNAAVRGFPDGLCLLDGKHRLIFANPTGERYTRFFKMSMGQVVSEIGGIPLMDCLVARADGLPHEVRIEEPTPRIFEIEAQPIYEEAPKAGWTVIFRDVTEQRAREDYQQQQDRLASVGQLAAGIAHDFNNMLTVMMGTAQIMDMHADFPEGFKEDARTIYDQGQRAAQLIRQILDFSRQTVVERQPLDLVPFLKESVKLIAHGLPENIQIDSTFEVERAMVISNPSQLQQIFSNLATNARDAMPDGGQLRVGLSHLQLKADDRPPLPDMAPGEWVVWTIADTGCGIPADVISHIYEPFFTTKKRGKGTGLGLAQVYGIVQQHNGCIDLESQEGKGTTCTIYLPQTAEEPSAAEHGIPDVLNGQGNTILVVEDDLDVQRVAQGMLEGLNYRVLTARNGQEALTVYDQHRQEIGVVLTDLVMPEMGGMELFKRLRTYDPHVRVVMMSGYTSEVVRADPSLGDVTGFLKKPLLLDEVAEAIDQAMR